MKNALWQPSDSKLHNCSYKIFEVGFIE